MTFLHPILLVVAVVGIAALVAGYLWLQRRRAAALAGAGLSAAGSRRQAGLRRHLPYGLFIAALGLLLISLARPQAMISTSRAAGTVILAFDVSQSMAATDVDPTRLAAAQAAALNFVGAQPDTMDIGVVAFGPGGLITQAPTADRASVTAAVNRLKPAGGTSLTQAILTSLTAIIGRTISLPADPETPPADLGYWGSATIVLLSDGEDTGDSDAVAAAAVAADAGVHIETVGVGTAEGTTIEIDGFQVATALDEDLLTSIADTTTGTYHRAQDAAALNSIYQSIDLRITSQAEPVELTGATVGAAVLLLTIGALLMIIWFGRIV